MEPPLKFYLEEVDNLYDKSLRLYEKIKGMEEFNRMEILVEQGRVSEIKKCKIEKDDWAKKPRDIKWIRNPDVYHGIDKIESVEYPTIATIYEMIYMIEKLHRQVKNFESVLSEQALIKYICTILPYWRNLHSIIEKEYETMNILNSDNAVGFARFLFSSFGDNYIIGKPCTICKNQAEAPHSPGRCFSCPRPLEIIPLPRQPIVPKKDTELELIKLPVETLRTKCKLRGVKLTPSDRKDDIIKKLLDSQK